MLGRTITNRLAKTGLHGLRILLRVLQQLVEGFHSVYGVQALASRLQGGAMKPKKSNARCGGQGRHPPISTIAMAVESLSGGKKLRNEDMDPSSSATNSGVNFCKLLPAGHSTGMFLLIEVRMIEIGFARVDLSNNSKLSNALVWIALGENQNYLNTIQNYPNTIQTLSNNYPKNVLERSGRAH